MRLKKFAKEYLNMYTPGIPDEDQCTGYKRLKEMIINQETPLEDDSNLLEFHVILRPFLKKHWETIKKLKVT